MKNNRKIEVGQVRASQFGTEYEGLFCVSEIIPHESGQYNSVRINTIGKSEGRTEYLWFEGCVENTVVVM